MVAGWMLHFVLVSALLASAGLLLEGALRRIGLPQRGVWATALAASLLIPALGVLRPGDPVAAVEDSSGSVEIGMLQPVLAIARSTDAAWRPALPHLDPLLLGMWAGASVLLLLFGGLSGLRLRRAMRRWQPAPGGEPWVLISECTGPAVVGIFPGAIVLPRWAESDPARELILAHEREHLRARDPLLLLAARIAVALLPWNLPLWWQLYRLRLAVEVDCDARVLGRGSDLRAYATLLLEVGRRRAGLDPALVAFAEPASFLERRLRIMTRDRRRRGWGVAAALGCLAIGLVAGACRIDRPANMMPSVALSGGSAVAALEQAAPRAGEGERALAARRLFETGVQMRGAGAAPQPADRSPRAMPFRADTIPGPGFTPRDVEPELVNRTEFGRAVEAAYPADLRAAGTGGRVVVWVYVDGEGKVAAARLSEASGVPGLDSAAVKVMDRARFSPAVLDGRPIPVWIALPLAFRPPEPVNPAPVALRPAPEVPAEAAAAARAVRNPVTELPPPARSSADLPNTPAFTPREVEPSLLNRSEFGRELERAYPSQLKEAGIGGRVLLWIFVDESGRVSNVKLYEGSGHDQLDAAAESVMRTVARFSPARNKGEAVPVWIAIPVTFATSD